jgi:hypothetical protein
LQTPAGLLFSPLRITLRLLAVCCSNVAEKFAHWHIHPGQEIVMLIGTSICNIDYPLAMPLLCLIGMPQRKASIGTWMTNRIPQFFNSWHRVLH